jgi:simple sugar transport system ATP-binding protein
VVGQLKTQQTNEQELANLMVGRHVVLETGSSWTQEHPKESHSSTSRPLLEVKHFSLMSDDKPQRPLLHDISLNVHKGEIVGLAGIDGNGQSDLLKVLLFPHLSFLKGKKKTSGHISIFGNDMMADQRSVKEWGAGVIPEDRHKEALLLDFTLEENYLLGYQDQALFQKYGFFRFPSILKSFQEHTKRFDVRPSLPSLSIRSLSGGNQQKLIFARELLSPSSLFICAQPTRGVDVGAIELIHHTLLSYKQEGKGILLISSELSEIRALSDRIYIFYEGSIVAEGKRDQWDETTMGLYMGGAKNDLQKCHEVMGKE